MAGVANPYAGFSLRIPSHEWEAVRRFTSTFRQDDGSVQDIDNTPFERYVDLWWCAICMGVQDGHRSNPAEWHDFYTGVVLNQDPWRIRQLELIAVSSGGVAVLSDPGTVIRIANEYAATGLAHIIDRMTGQVDPIWALTSLLRQAVEASMEGTDA